MFNHVADDLRERRFRTEAAYSIDRMLSMS